MTFPTRRFALLGALAASSLLLAACGSDSADNSGAKDFNEADVSFAQTMIPHHEQALEMARLAEGRAADAEIKMLVGEIEQAQDPEIKTLKGWLKDWDKPESAEMHHGGEEGMAGMMSEEDMTGLKAAKGADFDRKFAELMIAHHNGAIEMAEEEQAEGRNAEAKELAGDVVESQSAEVEQLKELLERF